MKTAIRFTNDGASLEVTLNTSNSHGPLVVMELEWDETLRARFGLEPDQAKLLAEKLTATAAAAESGR